MKKITVPFSEISSNIVMATIAIEDNTFLTHNGISPSSILRSILANIVNVSFSQGGSTITQQVVKNTILTKNKSLSRKLMEWVLAIRLEKHYTKNEILETYLNETPYGGTIYGVEEASQEYFNKSAKNLNLAEAAYLAAIPKAPTYYSPWGPNFNMLTSRQHLVLAQMLKYNLISKDEYEAAMVNKVIFSKNSNENIKAPHFVFYILGELEKKYGMEMVYNGGLQIITTLDWNLQKESSNIIRAGALNNKKEFNAENASLVAIDPKSGQILAMVGSRNYFDNSIDGKVNTALSLRQPGSTFKPFAYATAFKNGYTPETMLFDLKTQFSTACAPSDFSNIYPCYSPNSADGTFKGLISMREALAQSINVVAVKTLYLSGIKNVINTARALGISTLTDKNRYGLSLVLGGGEVTLLEMTAAYGAFANDGSMYKTSSILSIKTQTDYILEKYDEQPNQVLDQNIARTINDILSDNNARAPEFGFDSPLYFNNADVAAKTGTTNDFRDAWVIGYTPNIVVGTWAGNNDNTPMNKKIGVYILAPTWHQVMAKAIVRYPSMAFVSPENNTGSINSLSASVINMDENLDPSDPQFALWKYPVTVWANEQLAALALTASSTTNKFSTTTMNTGDLTSLTPKLPR